MQTKDAVAFTVQGPFIGPVQSNIDSKPVRNGGSDEFCLKRFPREGASPGGVDHSKLDHVGGLVKDAAPVGRYVEPILSSIEAVLKLPCTRLRAGNINFRKAASHTVGV